MNVTTVFGFADGDLGNARLAVEQMLGVRLEAHDSLYIGPYYRGSLGSGQSLQLRQNANPLFDEQSDPPDERFTEPHFPEARLLLYLHGVDSERALRLLAHAAGISFLAERRIA
ncbi:hypothetical protein [Chthoniobacter flavus]|uniref:hypothetical protein n=1 Tax=Chthoniobacter flavus TaxID=191863 RepID=UPI00104F8DE9|nr:hypothetical protein [Chthoniobacter flavus]